ncbi:MAG: hypothetical protein LBG17_00130 [Bacteroidales bacterium]|jgi:flagellar biosynthesis component FlhA|nr:hypothetical protein [Bacteroidales bacterium]
MKNKKYLHITVIMLIASIVYLLTVPLTTFPILTFLATISLPLGVLAIFILIGKVSIVKDKKTKRFFLTKKNYKK